MPDLCCNRGKILPGYNILFGVLRDLLGLTNTKILLSFKIDVVVWFG
jgi:hypothetical protein